MAWYHTLLPLTISIMGRSSLPVKGGKSTASPLCTLTCPSAGGALGWKAVKNGQEKTLGSPAQDPNLQMQIYIGCSIRTLRK